MRERLQKILSGRGVASRRRAEVLIGAGRVTVNGVVARVGDSADPEADEILLDGKRLPGGEKNVYILLHKPRGFVTTLSDERGRKTVAELVADCGVRVYPVGRLDMDSEGLLILTNDGEFANRMTHPRQELDKTYDVLVRGVTPDSARLLSRPIQLDGRPIREPEVTLLRAKGDQGVFRVTIHEGRNRQVRRMCQAAGLEVLRLRRIREGSLELGDLKPGSWRYLTEEEIHGLRK